jgi:hypothetical protein
MEFSIFLYGSSASSVKVSGYRSSNEVYDWDAQLALSASLNGAHAAASIRAARAKIGFFMVFGLSPAAFYHSRYFSCLAAASALQ